MSLPRLAALSRPNLPMNCSPHARRDRRAPPAAVRIGGWIAVAMLVAGPAGGDEPGEKPGDAGEAATPWEVESRADPP